MLRQNVVGLLTRPSPKQLRSDSIPLDFGAFSSKLRDIYIIYDYAEATRLYIGPALSFSTMASSQLSLLLPLLLLSLLLINHPVQCDDEEDNLLKGINDYRTSLNLSTLVKNENAECFAEEMADQFKGQVCTNTTGANTVPGTEPSFDKYPKLLSKCHLNISDTRDGMVMPACVPNLVASQLLSNFTQSQYSEYLNDTKYTGIGIGNEDDWMVVVLTTSTPGGSFSTYNAGCLVSGNSLVYFLQLLLMSFFLFF